jgi:hypothetical protein
VRELDGFGADMRFWAKNAEKIFTLDPSRQIEAVFQKGTQSNREFVLSGQCWIEVPL